MMFVGGSSDGPVVMIPSVVLDVGGFRMVYYFGILHSCIFWHWASGLSKYMSHQFFICYLSHVPFWPCPYSTLIFYPLLMSSNKFLQGSVHISEIFYG